MTLSELRARASSRPAIGAICFVTGAACALFLERSGPSVVHHEKATVHETSHLTETAHEETHASLQAEATRIASENKDVRVTVARRDTQRRDGSRTVTERVVFEDRSRAQEQDDARVRAARVQTKSETVYVDRAVDRVVEKTITVTPSVSHWRVAALVGINLPGLGRPLAPIGGPFCLGIEVDRRVVGPLWAGAWALNSGQAGVAVELEF